MTDASSSSRVPTATKKARTLVDVCPEADLPPGSRKVVNIGQRSVGVFNIRGEFFALPNTCSHQRGPLCEGKIAGTLVADADTRFAPRWEYDGEVVACPWHGLEFHIPTGQCLAHPDVRLRTYEVFVDDGVVKLAM